MVWTPKEIEAEWNYIYSERLGILCGDRQETYQQHLLAKAEADASIAELRKEQSYDRPMAQTEIFEG
jgi:hypothetical protein